MDKPQSYFINKNRVKNKVKKKFNKILRYKEYIDKIKNYKNNWCGDKNSNEQVIKIFEEEIQKTKEKIKKKHIFIYMNNQKDLSRSYFVNKTIVTNNVKKRLNKIVRNIVR